MTATTDPFDDPRGLQARLVRVLGALQQYAGGDCVRCGLTVCGHMILFNIVLGDEKEALCLSCLAAKERRDTIELRDSLTIYVRSKPCLGQGWRFAAIKEQCSPEALPTCLFPNDERIATAPLQPQEAEALVADAVADEFHDAGDQGCGDLVLELKIRMQRMAPGRVLELRALDPGAPSDIPAWCRLTGHQLLFSNHPIYKIQRKEDS